VLQQLQEAVGDAHGVDKKETSLGLNVVLQFLFQELKDTQKVRRYVLSYRALLIFQELKDTQKVRRYVLSYRALLIF